MYKDNVVRALTISSVAGLIILPFNGAIGLFFLSPFVLSLVLALIAGVSMLMYMFIELVVNFFEDCL